MHWCPFGRDAPSEGARVEWNDLFDAIGTGYVGHLGEIAVALYEQVASLHPRLRKLNTFLVLGVEAIDDVEHRVLGITIARGERGGN